MSKDQWANGFYQFHKSLCMWKIYKYYYILIAFIIQKPNDTLFCFWFLFQLHGISSLI